MAKLQVFTLENLTQYDGLIKEYIGVGDAKSLKTVAIDGNTLKFYRVEEPVGETTPAYEITLPETDISGLIAKMTGATAGNVVIANADGTVADSGISLTKIASDIEAAKKAGDDAQADVDTLAEKVGTVTEGKTIVEMISDAQTAATYDDTEIKADIQANADAIATLNGTGEGSVNKKITDAFNDFSTKVTDDAVVNSYKELIDWAAEHGSEAAEMVGSITTLENILDGIGGEGESATVVAYVQAAIEALKIGDYAKAADLTDAIGRIADLETAVGAGGSVDSQIDAKIADLDADVTSATVETGKGIQVQVVEIDGKVTSVAVTGNYDESYDAKGVAAQALEDAKDYADGKDEAIVAAKKAGDDAATAVTALADGQVATNTGNIASLQELVGEGYEAISEDDILALFPTA